MTSTGSRNPVSRRTGESTANVSSEEAIKEIDAFAAKIKAEGCTEEVFARYAQQRSDCGSFKSGGDLGVFGPGEMQAQFEQGCAATPVGTMSDVVLSDSGYHLIFRTR
uniref:Peptidyl-prolyl cis-trans isomerase n=1 Tax=Chrysotila carterae TaxID=13221 RepID=A0A7S4EVA2_CHRCT